MIEERQLTLIMENKPGALVRVVGLFHQRGYNIESLHVEPINNFKPYKFIEDELNTKFSEGEISRLEIKTTVDDPLMRQILRQINKLIDVIAVSGNEGTYLKGVLRDEYSFHLYVVLLLIPHLNYMTMNDKDT